MQSPCACHQRGCAQVGHAIIHGMAHQERLINTTGDSINVAFTVVVLASYFATFSVLPTSSTLEIVLLVVIGIVYISVGTYGYMACSRHPSRVLRLAYFVLQIPLGAAMVYLGKGVGFNAMVLLPLAGHSVFLLTSGWMLVCNAWIALAYVAAIGLANGDFASVLAGMPVFIAGQVFIVAFTQMAVGEERSRNQVERLLAELENANQQLRIYASQVEELAISRERNRLAREIHDGLGHYLTSIYMQIQASRAVADSQPQRALESLSKAQNLAQEALADVRRSVSALRAPEEDLPLAQRIGEMLRTCEASGMQAELEVRGTPADLPPAAHLALYRAAQEGLNNACKHAQAKHLWVTLDYTQKNSISLSIRDDGLGSPENPGGGFGLIGIRERVQLLNGDFRITTRPGGGFLLEITLPL